MLNRRITGALALVVVASSAMFACSSDTYSRDDLVKELTEDGSVTEEQANCVVDGLDEQGIPLKKNSDDYSDEDGEKIADVMIGCVAGDLGELGNLEDLEELDTTTTEES